MASVQWAMDQPVFYFEETYFLTDSSILSVCKIWLTFFQFYNVWLSLVGFLLCVAIMLLISWQTSLVTFAIFFTLYLIVHYRKPGKDFGYQFSVSL